METPSDFKAFQDGLTAPLVKITRTTGQISAEDVAFHRSSNADVSKGLDNQSWRLLRLTNKILKTVSDDTSVTAPGQLQNSENIDDNWRSLVDVIDYLLERADSSLDEYNGVIKSLTAAEKAAASALTPYEEKRAEANKGGSKGAFQSKLLPKPQLLFEKPPDNYATSPFQPLSRTKPHALVPLAESIGDGSNNGYNHPYLEEIEKLSFPDAVRQLAEPIPFLPNLKEDAIYVNSKDGVQKMLAELKQAQEIAVDLEHHDAYSYIGIVCLMQISTRSQDWIIDTLVPWREDLQLLNEVFADPRIVKVLHGSHSDVIWLQRDLGLYLVGLFDTYYACNSLNLPQRSLKYLLQRFCDFTANKRLQTADWRQRPLPQDMLDYARSDTHFLLFIYDHLRNMLLEASSPDHDLIGIVLENSKNEARQTYERPVYDVERGLGRDGWFSALTRRSVRFTPEQFSVFRAVHQWRDQMARQSDESSNMVMSFVSLFRVAEQMPLELPTLVSATKPVTRAVSVSFDELLGIIAEAKARGHDGPTVESVMNENEEFLPRKWDNRNARPRTQQDQGLGATLKMLNENGAVESTAERSSVSQLWGRIAHRAKAIPSELAGSLQAALKTLLPLPALAGGSQQSEEVETGALEGQSWTPEDPVATATAGKSADTMAAQEINGAHKRTAEEAGLEDMHDFVDVSMPVDNQLNPTDWPSRQRQNKGERRSKKAQKSAGAGTESAVKPFDYAGAESILHPTPEPTRKSSSGAKAKPQFNPYNKSTDASTGQKRQRKEIAGRSFTFKK